MKNLKIIFILIFLLLTPFLVLAKETYKVFDSEIIFEIPNKEVWRFEKHDFFKEKNAGAIYYIRNPILSPRMLVIEPVIGIVYEKIPPGSDLILYSTDMRIKVPFTVEKMILPQDIAAKYPNTLIYEGYKNQGSVKHSLLIAHMIYKDVGIQVICDSTADVYEKVKEDMMEFIKSVDFK